MTISARLEEYLKKEGVEYEPMHHSAAYTASEIAGAQHIPGKHVVKTVIVKSSDTYLMCVLSAIHLVDFDKLQSETGLQNLELASEPEVEKLFPDYEKGAEPPFGHLYGLKVYIDSLLEDNEYICFNAGTHTDMVKMKTADYIRLANGKSASFGRHV